MVSFGLGGILLALFIGWVTLSVGGALLRCAVRLLPLLLLVTATCLGGMALFGDSTHMTKVRFASDFWPVSDTPWPTPVPGRASMREGLPPFDGLPAEPPVEIHADQPTWMMVALGAVLVICGGLLATRRRPHSAAHKVLTVVGVAATGLIVLAVFNPRTRHASHDPDRVVRAVASAHEPASTVVKAHKAKRPSHQTADAARGAGVGHWRTAGPRRRDSGRRRIGSRR